MSEEEKSAMEKIAEIVPKLTKAQQEKLGYICEGIALACEKEWEEGKEHADHCNDDAAGSL